MLGGQFLTASGGFRDDADEGAHPFDRSFTEDTRVFTGSCGSGCTTGSTVVQVAGIANAGDAGRRTLPVEQESRQGADGGRAGGWGDLRAATDGDGLAGRTFQ